MSRKQRRAEKSGKTAGNSDPAANHFVQVFNGALALQQSGDLAGAEAAYRQAMAMNSKVPLLYNNFGVLLYSQGKLQEAIEQQKKAIALDPKMGMAHNNMGVALNAMGLHEEALKSFSKAIEIEPQNFQAINNYFIHILV